MTEAAAFLHLSDLSHHDAFALLVAVLCWCNSRRVSINDSEGKRAMRAAIAIMRRGRLETAELVKALERATRTLH